MSTASRVWALLIEYHGAAFSGWQRQPGQLTVQSVLEQAAARLNDNRPVVSTVAGRTDAGVHARAQTAMLAMPDRFDGRALRDALNFHMKPHAVVIRAAAPAPPGWNPRFSALSRRYRYRILDRPSRPALDSGLVWHVPRRLDAALMQQAATSLLGLHDFTSFRAAACQARSPIRTLDRLDVRRLGDEIEIEAEARSFLHHQVRNMVGTLRLVGGGAWPAGRVADAIAARNRAAAGPTAPPEGLTLMEISYDPDPFASSGLVAPVSPPG